MVVIKLVNDNILNAPEKFIAHQCNCVTTNARGLALTINTKYPWANIYKRRKNYITDKPGQVIEVSKSGAPHTILCLLSQFHPGKHSNNKYKDTYSNRKQWFQQCLNILDGSNYDLIAIPYGIGCGLAGGIWTDYLEMLERSTTKFVIYKI